MRKLKNLYARKNKQKTQKYATKIAEIIGKNFMP